MEVILHRVRVGYVVGETTLHVSYSPWRKAWLLAGSNSHGWAGRNADLMTTDFRTLRELREVLAAAFSVDQPERVRGCLPPSALKKIDAGLYRLELGDDCTAEVRKVTGGWDVQHEGDSLRFKSLWEVRRGAPQILRLPFALILAL